MVTVVVVLNAFKLVRTSNTTFSLNATRHFKDQVRRKFPEFRAMDHWASPGFPDLATQIKHTMLEDSKTPVKRASKPDGDLKPAAKPAVVTNRGENKKRDLGKCDSPSDDDSCSGLSASSPVRHSARATKKNKSLITGYFCPRT